MVTVMTPEQMYTLGRLMSAMLWTTIAMGRSMMAIPIWMERQTVWITARILMAMDMEILDIR
jgi:hypothetical protein